jgi:hypothetical protein
MGVGDGGWTSGLARLQSCDSGCSGPGLAPDDVCAGPREVDRIETANPLALEVALSVQQKMQLRWEAESNAKLRSLANAEQTDERQRQADQFKISATQRGGLLRWLPISATPERPGDR